VGLAPFASAFVSASVGFHRNYWLYWRIWFFSEVLAFLIVTPAVLAFFQTRHSWAKKSRAYFIEAAALLMATVFLAYYVFIFSGRSAPPALLYSLVPFLLWSALRFGSRGVTSSMILIAIMSIWGAAHQRGPFTTLEPLANVLSLQLFLVFLATPFMVLAVLVQEQTQTDQALRTSEEKFSKAFRESPMALTLTSAKDHRYLDVNVTFEKITGWRRDEVIGRTLSDIDIWIDPTQRLEFVKRLLAEDVLRDVEVRFRCRDGAQRVGLASAELIEIAGEPCVLGVIADITERKRAEEALSLTSERLRLAMEAGKSVGWDWEFANNRAVRFGDLQTVFGIPLESESGKTSTNWYTRMIVSAFRMQLPKPCGAISHMQRNCAPFGQTERCGGLQLKASSIMDRMVPSACLVPRSMLRNESRRKNGCENTKKLWKAQKR
jgi:PAS domain S-box-containing protein